MAVSFDQTNLIIKLEIGVALYDVKSELYQAWKDFMLVGYQNRIAPPAFSVTGGDDIGGGGSAPSFFFLRNDLGWRVQGAEADQETKLALNLYPADPNLRLFIAPNGAFNSFIINEQSTSTPGLQALIDDILEMFVNDATVSVGGGGERTVTIFEEDGVTIKNQMTISADGLIRTRII
jgi:hypothetical protein